VGDGRGGLQGVGVALAPPMMFERHLQEGRLVRPFETQVSAGRYWLTWLKSKAPTSRSAGLPSVAFDGLRRIILSGTKLRNRRLRAV
jgi:hypothetical protein